jgi:hypothetical protein
VVTAAAIGNSTQAAIMTARRGIPDLPVSLYVSSKFRANWRAVRPDKALRHTLYDQHNLNVT